MTKFDPELYEHDFIKDLKKVKARGFKLENMIMIDDTPSKLRRNYGNLVRVREFEGDQSDDELKLLIPYLSWLKNTVNVRTVEKRNWRTHPSLTSL